LNSTAVVLRYDTMWRRISYLRCDVSCSTQTPVSTGETGVAKGAEAQRQWSTDRASEGPARPGISASGLTLQPFGCSPRGAFHWQYTCIMYTKEKVIKC